MDTENFHKVNGDESLILGTFHEFSMELFWSDPTDASTSEFQGFKLAT